MSERELPVAVIDFSLGNLYSVCLACRHAGLSPFLTRSPQDLDRCDGFILPGVGAFGAAMETLRKLDMISAIRRNVEQGKPFMGICLGVQLLMRESFEFGRHEGLAIFDGDVVRFDNPVEDGRPLKIPQICWNSINPPAGANASWSGTPLEGIECGQSMYFVHSFHIRPADPQIALAVTRYGNIEFCSAIHRRNVFACQFHPERSGPRGLIVYSNWAKYIREYKESR